MINSNILLVLFLLCIRSAWSQDMSWELGAGIAGFDIPHYVGASQSRQYLIPVPYAKLKTEYLEYDQGLKGLLFSSPRVRLDLSADLGVPVRSEDSVARKGMPSLDTVLQLGPSVEIALTGDRYSADELRLEFPLRAAIATDIKDVENAGWLFEPRITFEHRRQGKFQLARGLEYSATLGLRYATREYHSYYYDVPSRFATAVRPQYTSGGGYSGLVANAVASWREGQYLFWAVIRYRNLNAAVYEASPLVEDRNYWLLGVGVTWVFAQSL